MTTRTKTRTPSIKFVCAHCDETVRVPQKYAGRRGRCPKCKGAIRVPGEKVRSSKPRPKPVEEDVPTLVSDREEKECPMCGEFVLAKAKKCRECGEWFDKKKRSRASAPAPRKKKSGGAAAGGIFGTVFLIFILIRVVAAFARAANGGY